MNSDNKFDSIAIEQIVPIMQEIIDSGVFKYDDAKLLERRLLVLDNLGQMSHNDALRDYLFNIASLIEEIDEGFVDKDYNDKDLYVSTKNILKYFNKC